MNPADAPIQFELESPDQVRRVAHVRIDPAHVERQRVKSAQQIAREIRLPGFRKGKVPVKVIRSRFAGDVEREAMDALIPEAYRHVIDHSETLEPISEPRLENFSMDEGQPVSFDLIVEVRPELEVQGHKGMRLRKEHYRITDERVDQAFEELRERNAKWETVQRGAKADDAMQISYVPLDAEGLPKEDGRNEGYSLTLGAEGVLPEFNSALEGLEVGEDTEVEVQYPEDYPREDLRGETMRFAVSVKDIREKRLPALDDEFAKQCSPAATLEELRTQVRDELEKSAERESERKLHQDIVEQLIERNDPPVPPSLKRRYLEGMAKDYEQMTRQEMDEAAREEFYRRFDAQADIAAKRTILLDNIRRSEKIEISDEELQGKLAELAEERGMDAAGYERAVRASNNLERLRADLEEEKLFEMICAEATVEVVEKDVEPAEDSSDVDEKKE
jgi:trigger factor